ncbi:hypothetical protein ScPMuIL_001001 [Solemya velum]
MSTFVSTVSPVTGKMEWSLQADNYDFHQEIARSAYADMLHDTERNRKYYEGLRRAVSSMRQRGRPVHVLDIGTGTGLLSMMAAKLSADTVTACEAFQPMADCARQIIEQNGFANKIKLIPKRSTDVVVGKGGDMEHRANILVTEVFDTELIGEGAIGTFNHAHKVLLERDCIVVPSVANMYVQLVKSEFVSKWNRVQPIRMSGADDIIPPKNSLAACGGAQSLHDLQLDQLPVDKFERITDPVRVFRFDFSGTTPLLNEEQSFTEVTALTSVVLLLWGHPNVEELQWRDHWMQAIYYPCHRVTAEKDEEITVVSNHDEYSLWFDVTRSKQIVPDSTADSRWGPFTYSRTRLGMLNDEHRQETYCRALRKCVDSDTVCVSLGDGSLLPLMAARLGAKKVFAIETNQFCSEQVKSFVEENQLGSKVKIIQKSPEEVNPRDFDDEKVSLCIGEPFFSTSVLPWHHLYFWYAVSELSGRVGGAYEVLPRSMTIKAMAVEFQDLWKIRAPVGRCEGFQLAAFDNIIEKSSRLTDSTVEPQPLWEYPCRALSQVVDLTTFNFTQSVKGAEKTTSEHVLHFKSEGSCNGVVLWTDCELVEGVSVSTGPRTSIKVGDRVEWDFHSKQGVHLLRTPIPIDTLEKSQAEGQGIRVKLSFTPENGDLDFEFCSVR